MIINCRQGFGRKSLLFALLSLFTSVALVQDLAVTYAGTTYQGFGTTTPGGSGGTVVRVTNLNDSGPGSFRDAVSKGNRTVVFDVGGEILVANKYIEVLGAFLTIDGSTATSPGITLKNGGLRLWGKKGAHDVIVREIRIRNAATDGIQIAWEAYNVLIDHVSIHGSGDGNLDISQGSRDVTVSWSVFAEPVSRKTMHHQRPGLGEREDLTTDVVGAELSEPVSGFVFLAHAHPHIGVEHVSSRHGAPEILHHRDARSGFGDQRRGRLKRRRRGDAELEIQLRRGPQPRDRHIACTIANEGDDLAFERAKLLANGLEIGENLARVKSI